VLFESERFFQLWRMTVSHGRVLLRSTKADGIATRIDVLFKNARAFAEDDGEYFDPSPLGDFRHAL